MSDRIVECVPNFSEGRNQEIIDAISDAGRRIEGARVLGVEPDADPDRDVRLVRCRPGSRDGAPGGVRGMERNDATRSSPARPART